MLDRYGCSSPPPDYQSFRGRVRVGPIDPRGGSAEQLPAHQPIGVVRRPFKEPPLTTESGGATRAAPLAMRAHRGTGSSHPLPSSEESANLPRYADRVVGRWSEEPPLTVPLANDHPVSVKSDLDQLFKFSQLADALAGVLEVAARDSGEGPARSGFRSALRDLIPRCETSQGFLRLSGPLDLRRGADFPQMGGPWLR